MQVFTALWALAVVIFGAMYAFLLFGWYHQRPMMDVNGTQVPVPNTEGWTYDEAMDWGNACMQILTAQFSYILFLTLPWRLGNFFHLWAKELGLKRRCNAEGFDLYGRPTNGIWFWIPTKKRKTIVALLVGNAFFQYATQTCRLLWPSYADSQTLLGALFINVTFVSSILCGIASGSYQGKCEEGVRKEHPDRFPPTPMEAFIKKFKEVREEEQRMGRPKRNSIGGVVVDAVAARMSRLSCSGPPPSRPSIASFVDGKPTFTTSFTPSRSAASGLDSGKSASELGHSGRGARSPSGSALDKYACVKEEVSGYDGDALGLGHPSARSGATPVGPPDSSKDAQQRRLLAGDPGRPVVRAYHTHL